MPPSRSSPPFSNPGIFLDRDHDRDHPDAPLPAQPYRDEPGQDELVRTEPRPITADAEGTREDAAAAARPRRAWQARGKTFWLRNKGMFLVMLAQMFGASMNVMTQVLEIHSSMHPFQVRPYHHMPSYLIHRNTHLTPD